MTRFRDMRYFRRLALVTAFLAFLVFSCVIAMAADNPILYGRVSDPSGADIVGATVLIRNAETFVQLSTTTDSDGRYSIQISPGRYDIEIKAACFKSFRQSGLRMELSASLKIDAELPLESRAEVVS